MTRESERAKLPAMLTQAHKTGGLNAGTLVDAANRCGVSVAQATGVATFYSMLAAQKCEGATVFLCEGPSCKLNGAAEACRGLQNVLHSADLNVQHASCLGLCDRAPAALLNLAPLGPLSLAAEGQLQDQVCGSPMYATPLEGESRIAMQNIGELDPDDLATSLAAGVYQALKKAITLSPDEIIQKVEDANLRGCGGAGFSTARKWRMVAAVDADQKFVICNADESEPGTFKDRVLLEGDPHSILEGMAIAGYATGATEGRIYIRGEYERAACILEKAIWQAMEGGWLGEAIQGSAFSFHVEVHRGAGAYICGEETALIESLEGRRGEPRLRPPYPVSYGLGGQPTLVNNVETLCFVPAILRNTAKDQPANNVVTTKMFSISGHVNRPGVFEAPLGTTLRECIENFGGGMVEGSNFKMALTGGAAGTLVGASALDIAFDFDSHRDGISMGSGAVVVADESVSASQLLACLLDFFAYESCGKCTPCREGSQEAREIVWRFVEGSSRTHDLERLKDLSALLRLTSLCGLGRSISWPIDSALKNYPLEFVTNRCR